MNWLTDGIKESIIEGISKSIESISNSNIVLSNILNQNAQQYSSSAFSLVMKIAEGIILPIAGVIFTYVVVMELIQMQMAQNNMHEHTTWDLFKWIFKTAIGVVLISNSFTIANAIIEVGAELVSKSLPLTNIKEVTRGSWEASSTLMELSLMELIGIHFSLLINQAAHWLGSILVNLFIISRFFEIYMYLMVAPIPFSTLTSSHLSQTGLNYIKNLIALALQAVVIIVVFAVYTAISATITLDVVVDGTGNVVGGSLQGLTLLLALLIMVWRSRSVSQSIAGL